MADRLRRDATVATFVCRAASVTSLRNATMPQTSPTALSNTPPMNSDTGPATLDIMTNVCDVFSPRRSFVFGCNVTGWPVGGFGEDESSLRGSFSGAGGGSGGLCSLFVMYLPYIGQIWHV